MSRATYVGKCVECGASLYYNADEDRLIAKGKMPGCLCHYKWIEEEKEEKECQIIEKNQ